jgi:hypothetical protein
MRPATLYILLFVVSGFAANAQLTILPQIGFENTRTNVLYNNLKSFAPLGAQSTPGLGVRLDYKFKQQHGPYLGISTSRSIAAFHFAETATGTAFYTTSIGYYQMRFEGGYQYSTKPIYFNKKKLTESRKPSIQYTKIYTYRSGCGGRTYIREKVAPVQSSQPKDKGWHMSVQPSLGAALIPSVPGDIAVKQIAGQPAYRYNAGNFSTAMLAGAGFEFGKNDVRKFVVTVQYLKGIGNLNNTVVHNISGAKETITTLNSEVSGFNVKAGIPITIAKKKPVVKEVPQKPVERKKNCERYSRCGKISI